MGNNQSRNFWLSLGLALLAVFMFYSYSTEKASQYNKKFGTTVQVVTAKADIFEMQTIDDSMLEIKAVPRDFAQPGYIENPEDIVGLVAAAPLQKGEQILNTKLLQPGPNTGLSIQVSPGKRAVTLPVDEVRGVAKLVRPGDRIDIFAVEEGRSRTGKSVTVKMLQQDVLVLATGIKVTNNIPRVLESNKKAFKNLRGDTSFGNVTIELAPKQAQDIIFFMASNPGGLYMTLRNPNDRNTARVQPKSSSRTPASPPKFLNNITQPRTITPPKPVPRPVRRTAPRRNSGGFTEVN